MPGRASLEAHLGTSLDRPWPSASSARPGRRDAPARATGWRAIDAGRLQRRLQAALGAAWLIDGALQLQPFMFSRGFVTQILEPTARGQPAIVARVIKAAAHLFAA
jgi:hypothetical protein